MAAASPEVTLTTGSNNCCGLVLPSDVNAKIIQRHIYHSHEAVLIYPGMSYNSSPEEEVWPLDKGYSIACAGRHVSRVRPSKEDRSRDPDRYYVSQREGSNLYEGIYRFYRENEEARPIPIGGFYVANAIVMNEAPFNPNRERVLFSWYNVSSARHIWLIQRTA